MKLRVDTNFKNLDDAKLVADLLVDEVNFLRAAKCQCAACKVVQHASYCAVHNAPALPIGKCDCGAEQR